jgi:ribosomal protein S21
MAVNVEVFARRNEDAERLIKRFSKKVRNEGIIDECKERMFFEKPSVKRNRIKRRNKKKERN